LTAVAPASAAFNAVDDHYYDERDYVMAELWGRAAA
jgi:hypothetical protein